MPLSLENLLRPGRGVVLMCNPNATTIPTLASLESYVAGGDPNANLPVGFTPLGDTSADDLPKWEEDGGSSDVLRTWWYEKAMEDVKPGTRSIVVQALQFDSDTMDLRDGLGTKGIDTWSAPANRSSTEKGLLVVYIMGSKVVGEFMPRTSVRGDGAIDHATDKFSQIPLRATVLTPTGSLTEHHWIGAGFGATSAKGA